MAISRFQSRFKTRTDLMDHLTPNNVVQMNASVPHGEWKPAAWLPVLWQNERNKDYFVMSAGKVVSLDGAGRVVPSGLLRRCLDAAINGTILTYTANDVAARVIDIRTGAFVTAADTVSLEEFATAILASGWAPGVGASVLTDFAGLDPDNKLAAAKTIARAFISAPVGILAYDVFVWAGDDPANLHFTNYQKQHLIQFFTDIQMKAAHVCDSTATSVLVGAASVTFLDSEALSEMPRYAGVIASGDNVVGYNLGIGKLASHTSRTPAAVNGLASSRYRSDVSLLGKLGDWTLDADAGIVLLWKEGGNAAPAGLASFSVFDYTAAASEQERMVMFVGDGRPGDFVSFDEMSNFVVATDDDHAAHLVVGRLLAMFKEPRGQLERVRTGWDGDDFDATSKMPGSATGGFSDLITLPAHFGESVADEIAVINVKLQ
jgi:hypothetical protein